MCRNIECNNSTGHWMFVCVCSGLAVTLLFRSILKYEASLPGLEGHRGLCFASTAMVHDASWNINLLTSLHTKMVQHRPEPLWRYDILKCKSEHTLNQGQNTELCLKIHRNICASVCLCGAFLYIFYQILLSTGSMAVQAYGNSRNRVLHCCASWYNHSFQ